MATTYPESSNGLGMAGLFVQRQHTLLFELQQLVAEPLRFSCLASQTLDVQSCQPSS